MAFGRQLCTCKHEFTQNSVNCYRCGIRKFENMPIKTIGFSNPIHTNMSLYFRQLKRRTSKMIPTNEISESTYNLLTSICDKFFYQNETLALGLYLYQCLKHLSSHEKFWASCCLIIASKGMQLDKNVPYLNRFQRYADKDYTQQQYQNAERTIFQAMNFDIQYSTFLTYINYYITSGVIFTNDDLNKSLVQYFQDDALLKAKQFLRKGNFSKYNQQKLALFIIKDTRKKYNLSQWTLQLEQLTGFKSQQIYLEQDQRILQPTKKQDINIISSSVQKSQKVVDLKNICIRKKLDQVSISKTLVKNSRPNSSIKQNSMSSYQQNSTNTTLYSTKQKASIILAPISSQYLSSNSIFNLATKRR